MPKKFMRSDGPLGDKELEELDSFLLAADGLATSDEERQLAYRGLFATELDEKELGELGDTVNRGWPLGSNRFKNEIKRALQCAARPPKRGRPSCKSELTLVAKRRQPVYRTEKLQ